jgi:hypothetical protein
MKHNAIVGNIGHFDNAIDMAAQAEFPGIQRINVEPQVDEWKFPDGHSVIVLAEGRLLNLGCATGHPSFVMSASFTNQVMAQVELLQNASLYEKKVYTLPKRLDERAARLLDESRSRARLVARESLGSRVGSAIPELDWAENWVLNAAHMSKMKHNAIVGNIGHFDNEIDMAALAKFPGIHRINVEPQVDEWNFPDGYSVIVLAKGRLLNLGCATGHPSFVISASFTNQVMAQIELFQNASLYEKKVYTLPKRLEERGARLHFAKLGVKLTVMTKEQSDHLGPIGYAFVPDAWEAAARVQSLDGELNTSVDSVVLDRFVGGRAVKWAFQFDTSKNDDSALDVDVFSLGSTVAVRDRPSHRIHDSGLSSTRAHSEESAVARASSARDNPSRFPPATCSSPRPRSIRLVRPHGSRT